MSEHFGLFLRNSERNDDIAQVFPDSRERQHIRSGVLAAVFAVQGLDLPAARISGLVEAMKVVSNIEGISFIHFDDRDVVRHKLVQQIVKAYEAFTGKGGPV
jgi:hypothetical protein